MPSFGLIHYNQPDLQTLDAFLEFAATTGFDAVELFLTDYWPKDDDQPETHAEDVRKKVEAAGLNICALTAANDFVQLDETEIEREVRRMERVCALAKILGTNVLRTEGGRPKDSVPEDRHVEAMAGCLKRCLPFIERDEIYLAVDNHGLVTNDADLQVRLFQAVDSPFVCATMDSMNYRWAGHDLDTVGRFYETIAPYVRHVHLKDGTGTRGTYQGTVIGDGEIDIPRAIQALKNAGYGGIWCIEYEGKEGSTGYAKCLDRLKAQI
ncbi:MAG: sugar phosphate isomerase/epimerase [bacterium]|nr:sugar phosphate isomerase/epimerase [bacterium]